MDWFKIYCNSGAPIATSSRWIFSLKSAELASNDMKTLMHGRGYWEVGHFQFLHPDTRNSDYYILRRSETIQNGNRSFCLAIRRTGRWWVSYSVDCGDKAVTLWEDIDNGDSAERIVQRMRNIGYRLVESFANNEGPYSRSLLFQQQ